jgi:hypothetical protein
MRACMRLASEEFSDVYNVSSDVHYLSANCMKTEMQNYIEGSFCFDPIGATFRQ